MKKILFLVNHDIVIYNFRLEIVEKLINDGYEVHISSPYGERIDNLVQLGAIFHNIVMDRHGINPKEEFRILKEYKKLIKSINPDVCLGFTIKPNIYGAIAARKYGIPFLANITGLGTSISNGGILAFITKNLYRFGLKKAACVFFQNEYNQRVFTEKKLIRGRTRLIPGSGVNLTRFCYEDYPNDSSKIRFLFVGRIMRDKGIDELLEAFTVLKKDHSNISLDIVGDFDGDYEQTINDITASGDIQYFGKQTDVRQFYKNAHCIVLPSYHEGMANVLLEASATGRPVIATTVPGCTETFDEGKTGFGCKAKNVDSLVSAMERFLSLDHSRRTQMGVNAREKMCKEFDRNIIVSAYIEEIEKINETIRGK